MKTSAIIRIVLYTLLFLTLLGILLVGIVAGEVISNISFGSVGGNVSSVGSVPADEIKNLEIEWAAGSVTIQTADVDEISFAENEGLTEDRKLVWKQYGDTLTFQFGKRNVFFGISFGTDIDVPKDLVITVPKGWLCKELTINGATLSIDIADLTIGRMELDSAATKLTFSGSLTELDCNGAAAELILDITKSADIIHINGAACKLYMTIPTGIGYRVGADGVAIDFNSNCTYQMSDGCYTYGNGWCHVGVSGIGCKVTVNEKQ